MLYASVRLIYLPSSFLRYFVPMATLFCFSLFAFYLRRNPFSLKANIDIYIYFPIVHEHWTVNAYAFHFHLPFVAVALHLEWKKERSFLARRPFWWHFSWLNANWTFDFVRFHSFVIPFFAAYFRERKKKHTDLNKSICLKILSRYIL